MLDVEVTPRAAAQVETAAAWWARNRLAAPDAIRIDFQDAKTLPSCQPGVGAKSSAARNPELRRLYLSLDECFTKQGYSAKDRGSEFDLIYVNGGNNLENLKAPDNTWKMRLIDEVFQSQMFELEDV